jgi:hypothetical protein
LSDIAERHSRPERCRHPQASDARHRASR